MKICSGCCEEKNDSNFYKRKDSADGLHRKCKSCMKSDAKSHYESNREERISKVMEYEKKNKAKIKERRAQILANLTEDERIAIREKRRANRAANREKISKRRKELRDMNIDESREKGRDYNRNYCKRFKGKSSAHSKVGYAIKKGELIRENCEVCGSDNTHAHHDDYANPLVVRWLCPAHHAEWHMLNGEGANGN